MHCPRIEKAKLSWRWGLALDDSASIHSGNEEDLLSCGSRTFSDSGSTGGLASPWTAGLVHIGGDHKDRDAEDDVNQGQEVPKSLDMAMLSMIEDNQWSLSPYPLQLAQKSSACPAVVSRLNGETENEASLTVTSEIEYDSDKDDGFPKSTPGADEIDAKDWHVGCKSPATLDNCCWVRHFTCRSR